MLEVDDVFRRPRPAYRAARTGHLSLAELRVMSAVETCRTAALGENNERSGRCGADHDGDEGADGDRQRDGEVVGLQRLPIRNHADPGRREEQAEQAEHLVGQRAERRRHRPVSNPPTQPPHQPDDRRRQHNRQETRQHLANGEAAHRAGDLGDHAATA